MFTEEKCTNVNVLIVTMYFLCSENSEALILFDSNETWANWFFFKFLFHWSNRVFACTRVPLYYWRMRLFLQHFNSILTIFLLCRCHWSIFIGAFLSLVLIRTWFMLSLYVIVFHVYFFQPFKMFSKLNEKS